MTSINQLISKQSKALMGPNMGNGEAPEAQDNPYFQNNYANLVYQQQQQQQHQQQLPQLEHQLKGAPQPKGSPSRPTNQGPSWC